MSHDPTATCLCVSEHRPAPLEYEWHHVWPIGLGGPATPAGQPGGNGVWLCPTAHTNVHEIMRPMMRLGPLTWGEVEKASERTVSRYAYRLALRGYTTWAIATQAAALGGAA